MFGHFLDHFPYFGFRGEEDRRAWYDDFARTGRLFLEHFNIDIGGQPYAVTAPFRIEEERRRLSWSGDGSGYHGWLQVRGHEDDCKVSLHIVIPADHPGAGAGEEISRGMTETLDRMQELAVRR